MPRGNPPAAVHSLAAACLKLKSPLAIQHNNEGLGRIAEQFLTKGAKVYVEGQLRTRKWQDQSGVDRYSTEIQLTPYNGTLTFLDAKKRNGERPGGDGAAPESGVTRGDLDDEIPY